MIKYEQWNKAIIKHIFEECHPDDIVFLNTIPDTLRKIVQLEGFNTNNAVESLKGAVKKKVVSDNIVGLSEISPNKSSKETIDQYPPQVAFLALTVVAANMMETLDYYKPLNELFFDDPDRGRWKKNDLENIEKLWKDLQNWVDSQHDIKLHLTQGPPNQRFVWYPKSQCLISNYDEHKIHAIFKEAKLKPGAYLAEKQLFDILLSSKYFQKLSVKIKRPFKQQHTAEIRLILGQIQLLLLNWDGEVRQIIRFGEIEKRRTSSINIQLKFNPFRPEDVDQILYWFRCGRSNQINLKPNTLDVESLKSDDGKWFDPFVVDAESFSLQVLHKGIEINSEEMKSLTYQLEPSDIWVFRNESEPDDGWFSQGNLLLHELHRLVFRKEQSLQVTSLLKHVCEPFTPPKSICVRREETDWQYVDVKPIVLCKSPILGFSITTADKIRLVDGIPLDRRSNTYFDFCLPTIVVPNHAVPSDEPFYFDGKPRNVPRCRKLEITDKLVSGEYQLSYLDSQITLRVISPIRSVEYEKQTFAIDIEINSNSQSSFKDYKVSEIPEDSKVWLSGAKFFGEDNIPLFIEGNKDTLVLSAAELISSVVKVAIELKQENTSPPEWFYKAINNLNQDIALRALVKKKLNDYQEIALSYHDLCSLGGD